TPGVVKVWDAKSGEELYSLKGHSALVPALAFSADSKRLFTGDMVGLVRVWDVTAEGGGAELTKAQRLSNAPIRALAAGGRLVHAGTWDGTLATFDAESGALLRTNRVYPGGFDALTANPDGSRVVTAD